MRLSLLKLMSAALAACALAPAASLAAPTPTGPDPTTASLRATSGPLDVTRSTYSDAATPGFGAATVFAPAEAAAGQRYGVVAFSPGFTENTSSVSWIARKVASYGFVTIAFNVNNTFLDFPNSRGTQLLAALDFVTTNSKERGIADPERLAASGHSMGGGASLEAARMRPTLKATVGLAPWNPQVSFDDVTVPSLEIGAQFDFIAPVNDNARFLYRSLPAGTPKVYAEMARGDHFVTNAPSARVGAATVAWLKRYVDEDTRYEKFICGAHTAIGASELSAFASAC